MEQDGMDPARIRKTYEECVLVPWRKDGPQLGCAFPPPVAPPPASVKWVSTGKAGASNKRPSDALKTGGTQSKRRRTQGGDDRKIALRDRLQKKLEGERAKDQVKRTREMEREMERQKRMEEKMKEKIERDKEKERLRVEKLQQREMEMRERLMIKLQREREKEQARIEREELKKQRAMEKIRQKEEREIMKLKEKEKRDKEREILKQQKDAERAAAANVMRAARGDEVIRKQALDLPDDEDIERDELAKALMDRDVDADAEADGDKKMVPMRVQLPPFPPKSVELKNILPGWEEELPLLLQCCSFLHVFRGMLGLMPPSLSEMALAIEEGHSSQLLSTIHVSLLQFIQFNLEDSRAVSGATHSDCAAAASAILEECWAWGFDVDAWRAHLNGLTWPEVMRQLAVAAGLGRRRPQQEDAIEEEENLQCPPLGAGLTLPARLKLGSVKACAYIVLSHAGPEGLSVSEIAEQVEAQKLRDLSTTRTPEASIAAALSKDVLFRRLSQTQFALQVLAANHRKATNGTAGDDDVDDTEKDQVNDYGEEDEEPSDGSQKHAKADKEAVDEDGNAFKKEWVEVLSSSNYSDLSRSQRLEALAWLCDLLTEQKTSREHLEARIDWSAETKKKLHLKFQEEKRRTRERELLKAQLMLLSSPSGEEVSEEEKKEDMERLQHEIDMVQGIIDKNKEDIVKLRRKLGKYVSRQKSLGRDRRNNRYWTFHQNKRNAPKSGAYDLGCIYMEPAAPDEASTTGSWRALCTENSYKIFSDSLNPGGRRECILLGSLKKYDKSIKETMMLQSLNYGINEQSDHILNPPVVRSMDPGNPHYQSFREWLYAVETVASVVLKEQKKKPRDIFLGMSCSDVEALYFTKLRYDFSNLISAAAPALMKKNVADRDWHKDLVAADTPMKVRDLLSEFEGCLRSSEAISPLFKRIPHVPEDVLERLSVNVPAPGGTTLEKEGKNSRYLSWISPNNAGLALRILSLDAALRYRGKKALREVSESYQFIYNPMLVPAHQYASSDEEDEDTDKERSNAEEEQQDHGSGSSSDSSEEDGSDETEESETEEEDDNDDDDDD